MPAFNPGFTRPRINTGRQNFRSAPPPNPFRQMQVGIGLPTATPQYRIRPRLGAINLAPTGKPVSPQQGAIAGAAAGSSFGPIGTVIGAAIGTVVGLLSGKPNTAGHIGGWDVQIASAIQSLPASAAGVGRQIPFNENSHGLVQMIEALMAVGNYMAWDTSIISNYDVCAHWAMTFGAAVQAVTTAIVNNPPGKQVTVSISESPGAGHGPINFTFTNPGIQIGPDKIAASIIMGSSGLMAAMMTGLGGQAPQNIASNASNSLAQKVFAYMVDNIAASLAPAATTPTKPVSQAVAPAVVAASQTVNAAVAAAPPASATVQPVATAPSQDDATLMAQNQAILSELQNLNTPQAASAALPAVATSTGFFGLSNTTLLVLGGLAIAAFLYMEKGK